LGIEVLELKNMCLLSKWLFKLLYEDGMWQQLLHNKYIKNKTLAQVEAKPTDSPFGRISCELNMNFSNEEPLRLGVERQCVSGRYLAR
jgi:hypothetical protein